MIPYITLGIAFPLLTALALLLLRPTQGRPYAILAAGLSAVCFCLAGPVDSWLSFLHLDALTEMPSVAFSLLAVAALLLLPRQDATPLALAGLLLHTASTHLCYAASSLPLLCLGWWMTLVPFLTGMFGRHPYQRWSLAFLLLSGVAISLGSYFSGNLSIALLLAAVVLRKGVFPFQGGSVCKFQHGPLIPAAMLFNSHLGAIVILKMPEHPAQQWLGVAALISAVLLALRTFAERSPRRMLGLISLSQASFILAGLTLTNAAGTTGAMLHWLVVSITSVGLASILRAVEVRVADARDPQEHLGLAVKTPRLASFFILLALPLIGLPGTLGYCAEDLLFHGALEEHVILGLALPIATAFNAIHLIRLFGILFLGVLPKHVANVPDALPRERWPLALAAIFLVLAGLWPKLLLPEPQHTTTTTQAHH